MRRQPAISTTVSLAGRARRALAKRAISPSVSPWTSGPGAIDSRLSGTSLHRRALRPGDALAAERIRPIEDDELDPGLGRRFQAEQQSARVGVETDAGVLQIEHQRVEAGEIPGRRLPPVAIEADDRQTARRIDAIRDRFAGGSLAGETVLGGEEADDVRPRSRRTSIAFRPSRVTEARVREQTQPLARDGRESRDLAVREPVEPDPDHGGAAASARTTASWIVGRASAICRFSRVGWTRLVSSTTKRSRAGSIQIEVPVKPVCPNEPGEKSTPAEEPSSDQVSQPRARDSPPGSAWRRVNASTAARETIRW